MHFKEASHRAGWKALAFVIATERNWTICSLRHFAPLFCILRDMKRVGDLPNDNQSPNKISKKRFLYDDLLY